MLTLLLGKGLGPQLDGEVRSWSSWDSGPTVERLVSECGFPDLALLLIRQDLL